MDKNLIYNPLVSIIMPAYNAEAYIEESIVSVQCQTYKNWELIIIDDGSTDKTNEIATTASTQDHRIKVIYQSNKKLGTARNAGLKISKGDWIAFLDSDDLWTASKLHEQLFIANFISDIGVIYTSGYMFSGGNLKDVKHYNVSVGKFTANEMYKMLYKQNQIPVLSVLIKRGVLERVGLQEEQILFHGCEDYDYWIRIAKCGFSFYGMEERLFYYRRA